MFNISNKSFIARGSAAANTSALRQGSAALQDYMELRFGKMRTKGWAGQVIEQYLGLPQNSLQAPDSGSWEWCAADSRLKVRVLAADERGSEMKKHDSNYFGIYFGSDPRSSA